jgi:hypothetical protein
MFGSMHFCGCLPKHKGRAVMPLMRESCVGVFMGVGGQGCGKGMECMELGGYVVGKASRMRALP